MAQALPLPENGWLSVRELNDLGMNYRSIQRKCKRCVFGDFQKEVKTVGGTQYRIHIYSPLIPENIRKAALQEIFLPTNAAPGAPDVDLGEYASAPAWARDVADRYFDLLRRCNDLCGEALYSWIDGWNADHPDEATSLSTVMRKRADYSASGMAGLLPGYGKRYGTSSVPDAYYSHFRTLMLKEGNPSARICWIETLGFARSSGTAFDPATFPRVQAFVRRLCRDVPQESLFRARNGYRKYNRRFGAYLRRDKSKIPAGYAWVADHAQIDVACSYIDSAGKPRIGFPWVTAWGDFKSGIWLGWDIYTDNPNSDHIFQAGFRAIRDNGTGKIAYLDNGKDFRSKDLSGGRQKIHLDFSEQKARGMLGALGFDVKFTLPHNAQSKPIERDFKTFAEWFSKMAPGYRGGNVVEKPECLKDEIAAGKIMTFDELSLLVEAFIRTILNKRIITSGEREGKSPEQIWQEEADWAINMGARSRVTTDALKLYCMRTSGDVEIRRGRVYDSKLRIYYLADWMSTSNGQTVYLRRDPLAFQEAWVFSSTSDEYIGKAALDCGVPGIAMDDVDRETLSRELARKKSIEKLIRIMSTTDEEIPMEQKVAHMAAGIEALNDARGWKPVACENKAPILATQLNNVAVLAKTNHRAGDNDYGAMENAIPNQDREHFDPFERWEKPIKAEPEREKFDPLDTYADVPSSSVG